MFLHRKELMMDVKVEQPRARLRANAARAIRRRDGRADRRSDLLDAVLPCRGRGDARHAAGHRARGIQPPRDGRPHDRAAHRARRQGQGLQRARSLACAEWGRISWTAAVRRGPRPTSTRAATSCATCAPTSPPRRARGKPTRRCSRSRPDDGIEAHAALPFDARSLAHTNVHEGARNARQARRSAVRQDRAGRHSEALLQPVAATAPATSAARGTRSPISSSSPIPSRKAGRPTPYTTPTTNGPAPRSAK